MITWYKVCHTGGLEDVTASKTEQLEPFKLDFALFWISQCRNNYKIAFQEWCMTVTFVAKGLLQTFSSCNISREVLSFVGSFFSPLQIHALITGPFDTPYEGGFYYFLIRCPPDYPIRPPRVKLMTTGGGQVRFNPNLYRNGKVCLSILG